MMYQVRSTSDAFGWKVRTAKTFFSRGEARRKWLNQLQFAL
jgi:hypothetical protein